MNDHQTSGVEARACRQVSSARGHGRRRRRHAISHVNKLCHQQSLSCVINVILDINSRILAELSSLQASLKCAAVL